jgi:sugar-specific transcriptional regulator TrmB
MDNLSNSEGFNEERIKKLIHDLFFTIRELEKELPVRSVKEWFVIINRNEIIKLLGTYLPDAGEERLNKMAEDIIIEIIPVLYTSVKKAVSKEKSNLNAIQSLHPNYL